ncbi:MAG: 2-oxoglutarate dehydrogenase, E2 component, dihydrolipoamide succinyltransferase [Actinomycetes bacterium]|jgi:pyruvate dehydrogenase E2 component (dihydrolipoamide acetyltransferase)
MSVSVTMPMLGESVTEGTVSRWLKNVGDTVAMDEPIVEVSTDKVDTEITAPSAGVILEISAPEDSVIAVGAQLALIGTADSAAAVPSAPVADPVVVEPIPAAPVAMAPEPVSVPEPLAQASVEPAVVEPAVVVPTAASAAGSTPVVLPALGESVTEGTVTRWLKSVGDSVAVDEPLVEISTDKVDTELPSPAAGVLIEITVGEDQIVAVGGQLGLIGSTSVAPTPAAPAPVAATPAPVVASEPVPVVAPVVVPAPVPTTPTAIPAPVPAPSAPAAPSATADAYVTPLVRKLASDSGVDLSTVTGSGVGGRIRKEDILAAAAAAKAAVPAAPTNAPTGAASNATPVEPSNLRGTTVKMSRLRKVIAERMVESLQTSAQLTTVVEVDVTRISQLRDRVKTQFEASEGVKLSFLPFFAKATIEALKQYPQVNASIDLAEGTVTYPDAEHLGIAVDTDRGLLVPVIRDAGDLSIGGLARKIADVAGRTRTSKVSPDELSGGTFTLTNTGSRGALFDTPIINQPQVAILGTGAVVKRPVVVTDETGLDSIAVRSMVYLALTYDHRLVDGADAARFLTTIKQRLEDASFDAELGA